MKYDSVRRAIFINRPNRFIANVMIDDTPVIAHVKNTGRCREILQPNTVVILDKAANPNRKTEFSLVAAYKESMLINIDSQIPNMVVYDAVKEGSIKELPSITRLSREVVYGNSRFDLYYESDRQRGFIEVKGVTLETDKIASFPDAPTERGCKHIYELIKAVEEGYQCFLFFLIQLKGVTYFTPNEVTDPDFTKALRLASLKGVTILAYDSIVQEDSIVIGSPVPTRL